MTAEPAIRATPPGFPPYEPDEGGVSAGMLDTLLPLQRLTSLGLSVFALHHPKQGRIRAGQAARGRDEGTAKEPARRAASGRSKGVGEEREEKPARRRKSA